MAKRVRAFRPIQSIERMDRLLAEISRAGSDGLRLSEVAARAELHKNTAFSILKTMKALGYCDQDSTTHTYRVGRRTFEIARFAERNLDVVTRVRPLMLRLVWQWHESMSLAVPAPDHCVVVTTVEGSYGVRGSRFQGQHAPYHASALGKAILAFLSEDERSQVLTRMSFSRLTSRTITTRERLEAECSQVHAKGHAVSIAEEEVGASAVAVPLFTRGGIVAGALAVWGPSARLTRQALAAFGTKLALETKNLLISA